MFDIKPLAARYIAEIARRERDKLREILIEAAKIAELEGHRELRAKTVLKAYARIMGKNIEDVLREIKPRRL